MATLPSVGVPAGLLASRAADGEAKEDDEAEAEEEAVKFSG